jgi:hypothetical protein
MADCGATRQTAVPVHDEPRQSLTSLKVGLAHGLPGNNCKLLRYPQSWCDNVRAAMRRPGALPAAAAQVCLWE